MLDNSRNMGVASAVLWLSLVPLFFLAMVIHIPAIVDSFVVVPTRRSSLSSGAASITCADGVNKLRRFTDTVVGATAQDTLMVEEGSESRIRQQRLEQISHNYNTVFETCRKEITRTCNVKLGPSSKTTTNENNNNGMRLGWIATKDISKGELLANMPYDELWELSPKIARKTVFKDVLDDTYEGWCGDTGLIALLLLNEVARTGSSSGGIAKPQRPINVQSFIEEWVRSLPTPEDMKSCHPLLWNEDDQEVLQSSSNTKVYRILDDIEEDANWLIENIFEKDRNTFPETIQLSLSGLPDDENNNIDVPCFGVEGYKWAMTLAQSRAFFVDGTLRIMPFMDGCNHDDDALEIRPGYMGTFGTTKGTEVVASTAYKEGEEVFTSYGPKSSADYLLEHGFCPRGSLKTAVSEITLEIDPEDPFYDDKLDILEYETYDLAPMDPTQSFDVVSAPGRDGDIDPALLQFARLIKLNGQDSFMLESIFRKEVWGFMAYPVSEKNELAVVEVISEICESSLEELNKCPDGGPEICTELRMSETKALKRTLESMLREKEALDLKEYYQERRLKDLGLDSDWSNEDDAINPDLGFGQTRAPGSDF